MNLRVRGPNGQFTLTGLEATTSLAAFLDLLEEKSGMPAAEQELLRGFPPQLLQLPANAEDASLASLGLRTGDTLVLRRGEGTARQTQTAMPVTASAIDNVTSSTPATAADDDTATVQTSAARFTSAPSLVDAAMPVTATSPGIATAAQDTLSEDEELARAIAASLSDINPSQQGQPSTAALGSSSQPPSWNSSRPQPSWPAAPRPYRPPSRSQESRFPAAAPTPSGIGAPTYVSLPDGSAVVRRVIDSDNSCLFNAVGLVMEGSRKHAQRLRDVIAKAVASDPDTYSEGFLGKPNQEYQKWIRDSQKWGGAIELSILSRHFAREIAAYDIQTKRCDVYGQDVGFSERSMVIYDGLHYDALAVAAFPDAPEELDVTIFDVEGGQAEAISRAAAALVEKAHEARQFTDTANFTLRCNVCQIGLNGEKEAVQHAQETGHQNFVEYS